MQPVSSRQFVKMVGVSSDNAARKAVERGSIVDGVTAEGKFIPLIAAQEWGKEILPEYLPEGSMPKKATPQNPVAEKAPRTKKEKPATITAAAVVEEVMAEKLPPVTAEEVAEQKLYGEAAQPIQVVKKPEAERRTAILKYQILEIALAEKLGQVVDRNKIAGVLFTYGQETRIMFEGISNRVIDRMRAADSREEAKRILDDEIHDTLTALADIPTREL